MNDKCMITTVSNKKITIKQIAEDLGYSPTVVSHSLSHKGTVGEKTRKYIIDYAKKVGYKPSLQAQTVRKKVIRVAVYIPYFPNFVFKKFIAGVKSAIDNFTGNSLECDFLNCTKLSFEQLLDIIDTITKGDYDGAILSLDDTLAQRRLDYIERLNEKNIPIICIGNKSKYIKNCGTVHSNNEKSGAAAADILNISGCKNPLVIFGNTASVHERARDGFIAQAQSYGMNVTVSRPAGDNEEIIYNIAKEYLKDGKTDGIYLTNCFAWAVSKAMDEADAYIPFVSMDLFEQTKKLIEENKLTATICQHQSLQGQKAMEKLLEMILSGDRQENDIAIQPELVTKSYLD